MHCVSAGIMRGTLGVRLLSCNIHIKRERCMYRPSWAHACCYLEVVFGYGGEPGKGYVGAGGRME